MSCLVTSTVKQLPAVLLAFLALTNTGYGSSLPETLRTQPGLIVVVGGVARADQILDALAPEVRRVVHWLDADADAVRVARERLQEQGLYGTVTVETWTSARLPYAENLVNAILVKDPGMGIGNDEILRVLTPNGTAYIPLGADFQQFRKPRPPEMGDWTHPRRDADGNPLSPDTAFDIPNGFQWIAGPTFPFDSRKSSARTILSAGGRIFAITHNAIDAFDGEERVALVARDGFNGLPLWSIPWSGSHVIVATADRLFTRGGEDDIRVLDAATGAELARWPIGADPTKLLLSGGLLVAQTDAALAAIDVNTGATQWRQAADNPYGVLAADRRVYALEGSRQEDGRWAHQLVCRDLTSGETRWSVAVESEYGHRTPILRIHFAGASVVCLLERTAVRFLAAEDGSERWSYTGDFEAPRGDTRGVGHFLRGDEVWLRHKGSDWLVCHPHTGEIIREMKSMASGRMKCQPTLATERFVLNPRTSSAWDMQDGTSHSFNFSRGGCEIGIIPANGLGYTIPNACGCTPFAAQVHGFLAITTNPEAAREGAQPGELEKGPAYERDFEARQAADVWPHYRANAERGAWTALSIPSQPAVRWQTALDIAPVDLDDEWRLVFGHPYTAPTVGAGLVTLARPQAHQIIALDPDSGEIRWRYTADGRITTPPTHHAGLVLFGAHDGNVYALDARDGALIWRRRAAPADRRIMVHGQLESPWPVVGGILVQDGIAVAAAGRSPLGEGGILVHAFAPRTGDVLWTRRVDHATYGAPDLLVAQGDNVFLMDQKLDLRTGDQEALRFGYGIRHQSERGGSQMRFPEGVRYLRSGTAGFSENAWTRVGLALRKGSSTWTLGENEGELLAFGNRRTIAYQIDAVNFWGETRTEGGGMVGAWAADSPEPLWRFELEAPSQVEALIANDDVTLIAGPTARTEPMGKGFLSVLDGADGAILAEIELPVAPVHDGLAAADGTFFAVLRDGTLMCFGN